MDGKECIEVFNSMIKGIPVPFAEKLLPMFSEYIENVPNSDKILSAVVNNPQLVQNYIPDMIDFYCRKYNIFSLKRSIGLNDHFNNNQTILYYE